MKKSARRRILTDISIFVVAFILGALTMAVLVYMAIQGVSIL